MKRFRVLTAALCAAVLLCGFAPVTAYAGGGEDWEGLDPVEPAVTEEPVIEPGEGFSEDGNKLLVGMLVIEQIAGHKIAVLRKALAGHNHRLLRDSGLHGVKPLPVLAAPGVGRYGGKAA